MIESQAEKLRAHCERISDIVDEKNGWTFRRICRANNSLLDRVLNIDDFTEGHLLLEDLHRRGCDFGRARLKVKSIADLVNGN